MYQSVKLLICSLLAGPWLIYMAVTNDRGLVLNGIIKFGPTGATVFYALVGSVGLIVAAVAARSIWQSVAVSASKRPQHQMAAAAVGSPDR